MKTVILPFASLSTHAFHVLDTTRSNPFQEHGTTLDRSPRQVIHPFQKRAMVVVSQHKPGENVSDHNISSGPNDEASSSGALQPSLPVNNANFPVKEGNQGNMPEQSVWVKVIQKTGGDNYEDLGDPFQILPRPANVSDLRNKVKEEAANTLAHVDANELLVFAPDKDYENDKPQLSVSGAMADRDDKAEGDKRDSSPAKGGGRGRRSGMGRGRGRGGARHAPDYWSLAQPEFRQWLSNITTKAEYNRLSIAERGQLLRDFGISQQRGDGDTPQQRRPSSERTTVDNDINAMQVFFDQDISLLKVNEKRFIQVKRMEWFDYEIRSVYWRHCYSYILCSTIAFFEKAHQEYANAKQDDDRKKSTMVLTGVQGTGKSILGAIIGLFMAKLFGWEVHYTWSGNKIAAGQPRSKYKTLHIVDLSRGGVRSFPPGFLLIVSSANKERWSRLRQQQNWSDTKGNFCYIDSASKREVIEMAANKSPEAVTEAEDAFYYVGGVPRLCLQNPEKAQELVDGAISIYGVEKLVNHLSVLDDSSPTNEGNSAVVGQKLYPGLVGHMIPTDKFRNKFKLQIPSPYIGRSLLEKEESRSDDKLQKLMEDLLAQPKARSVGGWIWEPLLTRNMRNDQAHITIVGSELPVDHMKPSVQVLLQESASKIEVIEFTTMQDFSEKAKAKLDAHSTEEFTVFAKATSETFAAIDAIIMIKRREMFSIAALQLTVAEKNHPVKQWMILEFVKTCKAVDDGATPQLWFLQPKESLSYFGFVKLQAMQFNRLTYPNVENELKREHKRKKTPSKSDPNSVPSPQNGPKGKMQSNDKTYWDNTLQSLPQYIGIVQIDKTTTVTTHDKQQDNIRSAFLEKLKTAFEPKKKASSSDPDDPPLRCWSATRSKMEELKGLIHESLMTAIRHDIDADQQSLVDAGFVF